MKTITVANIKGGSTKTTTAIHLAACLSAISPKVLAVDLDPQSSLTDYFFPELSLEELENANSLTFLEAETTLKESVRAGLFADVMPATLDLAFLTLAAAKKPAIRMRLRNELRKSKDYNYAVIDTPGSAGTELYAALLAADLVLIPVTPSKWTRAAVSLLMGEIENAKEEGVNPKVAIVPSMFGRGKYDQEILDSLKSSFPILPGIPKSATIQKKTEAGEQVKGKSLQAYEELAEAVEAML